MRVIARSRLREFWEARKTDRAAAERDLLSWHQIAENARWANFGALKQTFGTADQVGNCVVFDVGNNRFRLIGRVMYGAGRVYVLKIMDHAEYDEDRWAAECGCHEPPPKREATPKGAPARKTPPRGQKGRK